MTQFAKPGFVQFNGRIVATVTECTCTANSDDKPVRTLIGGEVGYSDGAEYLEIDGKGAVPAAGYEVDFMDLCLRHLDCEITFNHAGKALTGVGRITASQATTSVDNPSAIDFKARCHVKANVVR